MNKSKEELIQIYYRIIDYFLSGVLAFVVIKTLREEYQKKQEPKDDIFISALFISVYNTEVLALANTIKPNPDSVHLAYLFNCIKTSKNELDAEIYSKVTSFIIEFEAALKSIEHITNGAIKLRNTSIAHLDRKHINDPTSLIHNPPIKWDDIELAYNIIGGGLMEIGKHLGLLDIEPYTTIANFILAEKTRQVFRLLYVTDKAGSVKPFGFHDNRSAG